MLDLLCGRTPLFWSRSWPPHSKLLSFNNLRIGTCLNDFSKLISGWTAFVQPAPLRLAQKRKINMNNSQLELGLGNGRGCRPLDGRQRRLNRAKWWFDRMRQVVDRAFDWTPAPAARPEQIWFNQQGNPALAGAPATSSAASSGFHERQICE